MPQQTSACLKLFKRKGTSLNSAIIKQTKKRAGFLRCTLQLFRSICAIQKAYASAAAPFLGYSGYQKPIYVSAPTATHPLLGFYAIKSRLTATLPPRAQRKQKRGCSKGKREL